MAPAAEIQGLEEEIESQDRQIALLHDETEGPVIVWFSPKLGYPVRIHTLAYQGEGDMIMEYRNINTGKVPDSMFEIPGGYKKFAIPGMPAGMPGGMPKVPGMGK